MTKAKLNRLESKFKTLVDDFESSGFKVKSRTKISRSGDEISFVISVSEEQDPLVKEAENLALSKRYKFTQNIVGMEFDTSDALNENGKVNKYKITNFMTENRKYPIIAECVGGPNFGKSYKFSPARVKSLLGGDKLINRISNLDAIIHS